MQKRKVEGPKGLMVEKWRKGQGNFSKSQGGSSPTTSLPLVSLAPFSVISNRNLKNSFIKGRCVGMNTHISQSIIMRIKDFGESDLLVTFFTSDRGWLKGVAKGGRRSRKRFANCLDLLCLTDLEYVLKKKGDLYFLNSCKLIHAFPGLRSDFYSLSLASYMVELAETLFPQNVVDNNMFELMKKSFMALDDGVRNDVLRILFEAKTMALGGYGINLEKCCKCGRPYTGTGRAVFLRERGAVACLNCAKETALSPGMEPDTAGSLNMMQSAPWDDVGTISLSEEVIREIKPVLKLHLEYRVGKRLKSAKYLD